MLNYDNVFHLGIIVPQIEQGMEEIGRRFGVTWAEPTPSHVTLPTEKGPQDLSFVYSYEGPPHLELIEAVPNTIWEAGPGSRIHHIGIYVDDVESEVERLTAEGAVLDMAGVRDGRITWVSYLNSELGVRIELCPEEIRPGIEALTRR